MGVVYHTGDIIKPGRQLVIKVPNQEVATETPERDCFLPNTRMMVAVERDDHAPVSPFDYAWDIDDIPGGEPFVSMQVRPGELLDARPAREPVSPLDLVLKVARAVATGLAAAHAKGLVHRDVKHANLWLESPNDRVKILDFGLARSVDTDAPRATAPQVVMGTLAYMAPERARGEKVDHRSDLFSLGVVLYEMATGQKPFVGGNASEVMAAVVAHEPPGPQTLVPALPPAISDLIGRMLAKNPADRPQPRLRPLPGRSPAPCKPRSRFPPRREPRTPPPRRRLARFRRPPRARLSRSMSGIGSSGGSGERELYSKRGISPSRRVAIKTLHPNLVLRATDRNRGFQKLELQAQLHHPNVIPAFDWGECPLMGLYIVMPLVVGSTLRARLAGRCAADRPFDVRTATAVMYDVARGLACMHARGLVHRDVKPSNILLPDQPGPTTQLFDFGITRSVTDQAHLTAGEVVGTRRYMSPEQTAGAPIDYRFDLFALGVVAWEMLCGICPCSKTANGMQPVRALRSDVPASLSALIDGLVRPDPAERPKSADKVVARLDHILEHLMRC